MQLRGLTNSKFVGQASRLEIQAGVDAAVLRQKFFSGKKFLDVMEFPF